MDNDQSRVALDDSYLQESPSSAGTYEHREAVIEVEDAKRVGESVQHVLVIDTVLPGTGRDVRPFTHRAKLSCRGVRRKDGR